MLFNSAEFILFLPIVIGLYYLIPGKYRWVLLLLASYFFYMCWRIDYILLIIGSTLVDYFVALQMEKSTQERKRKLLLWVSLAVNIGLLTSFKYFNFFSGLTNELFGALKIPIHLPYSNWLLPVGISFYTFQTLSYTIDVYFRRIKAEKHLGYFALYVSFFPQLVAGPIERFSRLSPQFKKTHVFTYTNLANGLRLILYGLFIKMVIADNLAGTVESIYQSPEVYQSAQVALGICFYSFQIYCDFYGYSLVAIGSALMMGITIMDNFKTPYMSRTIAEFWQRWHISLSTWFRDYLYYPMGGNKVSKSRWMLNIFVVFVVSGLWHGANTTFLLWGALFGFLYLVEKAISTFLKANHRKSSYGLTDALLGLKTFVLVSLIWVFFRSPDFATAMDVFQSLFHSPLDSPDLGIPMFTWVFLSLFILSDVLLYNKRFDQYISDKHPVIRWLTYYILLFAIIVFSGVENFPFIYFQF